MDYVNNGSNSYGSGEAVSSSLANMSIHDQRHQENGVQMAHRSPGDAKMKGQSDVSVHCPVGAVGTRDVTLWPLSTEGDDINGMTASVR